MNCQVSPFYRTNPDPRYYKLGTLYDSDCHTVFDIINSSREIDPKKNIGCSGSEAYPNVG